jgi:hypothetical protein
MKTLSLLFYTLSSLFIIIIIIINTIVVTIIIKYTLFTLYYLNIVGI